MQASEGGAEETEKSCWQRFKSALPFIGGETVLGQGLAQQVGNVTECALLGFLVDLGEILQLMY